MSEWLRVRYVISRFDWWAPLFWQWIYNESKIYNEQRATNWNRVYISTLVDINAVVIQVNVKVRYQSPHSSPTSITTRFQYSNYHHVVHVCVYVSECITLWEFVLLYRW